MQRYIRERAGVEHALIGGAARIEARLVFLGADLLAAADAPGPVLAEEREQVLAYADGRVCSCVSPLFHQLLNYLVFDGNRPSHWTRYSLVAHQC